MTKAEQKQIEREMSELASRARVKVINLCSTISAPYELEALRTLRQQIDIQIQTLEDYLEYAKKDSI